MMSIGITGHRGLPAHSVHLIDIALHEALAEYGDHVTGVTALADGTDQLFARAILDQGGQIALPQPPSPGVARGIRFSKTHLGCTDLISQNQHPKRTWQ